LDIGQHVLRVFSSSNNADEPHPPAVVSWTVTNEKPWDQTAVTFEGKWVDVCTDAILLVVCTHCNGGTPFSLLLLFVLLHVLHVLHVRFT